MSDHCSSEDVAVPVHSMSFEVQSIEVCIFDRIALYILTERHAEIKVEYQS
jgi:hypothetical protein